MPRQLLRMLVAIATLTVVWLVASPASAMTLYGAPVCDPRGAIGFAPPPQIQDEERSLDIPADCFDVSPLETRNAIPGRGVPPDFSSTQDPTSTAGPALLGLAFVERLPILVVEWPAPPTGVRTSVDRPPQA